MGKTLLRCTANTAKVVMFTGHAFIIIALTGFFRNASESTGKFLLLLGIIVICISCCVLGALFGSSREDVRRKVKIRAGKKPIIFSIQLPIEKSHDYQHTMSKSSMEPLYVPYDMNMKLPSYDDIILSPTSPVLDKNFDRNNNIKIV